MRSQRPGDFSGSLTKSRCRIVFGLVHMRLIDWLAYISVFRRAILCPAPTSLRRTSQAERCAELPCLTADIEANPKIREPQQGAHRAVRTDFETSNEPVILQIPVGCGKTGIMATLPFGIAKGRVLVITPNLTIRNGVAEVARHQQAEELLGADGCSSRLLGRALSGRARRRGRQPARLRRKPLRGDQHPAARQLGRPLAPAVSAELLRHDPGRRGAPRRRGELAEGLPPLPERQGRQPDRHTVPVRSAAACRRDRLPLPVRPRDGERLSSSRSTPATSRPSELYFTYRDDTSRHALDEVLELREEAWFRRGVALSPRVQPPHRRSQHPAAATAMRAQTGIQHQIIAAPAPSTTPGRSGPSTRSAATAPPRSTARWTPTSRRPSSSDCGNGQLDCIVQVQMLGEGFDHPRSASPRSSGRSAACPVHPVRRPGHARGA